MIPDRGRVAPVRRRDLAAHFGLRKAVATIRRAPHALGFRPRLRVWPRAWVGHIANFDAKLVCLGNIPVQLPAIAAVDVRENGDAMLDGAIRRRKYDL